ncbi:uncharacterized protein Z518_07765 [Rhinocladiella mackenziei CBS 650.93]|uniref:Rhinocladiella mackenziei CBS 650.93 unplaced genomic scaffold supercont1.5, whole genome shotgun sequence n=1 Tax=Rhinocladiella mackenziei CBS 650.93 TaxID=1442369 RepID=A0A0D2IM10_9EURO|nr:uncharacterized protein Z518_07765 [Rhinocladiella mackenziei CBS 650.93]KIX04211.1 hypothetical protein Z518_07765 [Rhinocladiella mackenziei CBS 650.93]
MAITPPPDWLELQRTGKTVSIPFSRTKVLFGPVNEGLPHYFPDHARARIDAANLKYVFSLNHDHHNNGDDTEGQNQVQSGGEQENNVLPENYSFADLRDSDLQLALDRTHIPRTLNTLRRLVSVGLFYNAKSSSDSNSGPRSPVGWGFLGKDASIPSLHIKPEHRGEGLVVCLSKELINRQEKESAFAVSGKKGGRWAHADVSWNNVNSRRVMEKLGGKSMWTVAWTEVDLSVLCGS